jgi:hypothetical protein
MYIKYELNRAKNGEVFNREMIEWVLETDRDLIELDDRLNYLLAQHISNIEEVKKYGTGYIGSMKIVGLVINDNDYVGDLDEEAFKSYLSSTGMIGPDVIEWNRELGPSKEKSDESKETDSNDNE